MCSRVALALLQELSRVQGRCLQSIGPQLRHKLLETLSVRTLPELLSAVQQSAVHGAVGSMLRALGFGQGMCTLMCLIVCVVHTVYRIGADAQLTVSA